MSEPTFDAIKKEIFIEADLYQVWRAIAYPTDFGAWFGMAFESPEFVVGQMARGRIVPTSVNDVIAARQKPYEGLPFEILIRERLEPHRFQFQWHPFAVEKGRDYSNEPMTRVRFDLHEIEGSVRLTVTESGFDNLFEDRRHAAYKAEDGGWSIQMSLISAYITRGSLAAS